MQEYTTDAIIIGAGLGGLLSAVQLLQRGKQVIVLERLPHSGGRFTAKTFQGVQVSTGAVHMLPFGSSGVLAKMLGHLQVPHRILDANVFGSFHVYGKQYRSRGLLGVFKFLGPRQFFRLICVGCLMFLRSIPPLERTQPFDTWLAKHCDVQRNRELVAFFACISRFALSLDLHQVTMAEVVQITKNMFSYGAPGIVQGGCGALTAALEHRAIEKGAEVRLYHDVLQICTTDGHVSGVRVRDKTTGEESLFSAPLVVSDIGPRATNALLHNQQVTQAQVLKKQQSATTPGDAGLARLQEAVGLKVHFLSDVSLIPHRGIMYCLDTQRIAGIVQPTNCDPRLAPAGKHLLISHQVIQSNNIEEEKSLALADLRMLFGETFDRHCRILTMSVYRGEWPVNRVAQGEDVATETDVQGVYLVGDAVKPSGYLMVEGVAQSVNQFLDLFDASEQGKENDPAGTSRIRRPRNVAPPPSRINVLRWLWNAPGNARNY